MTENYANNFTTTLTAGINSIITSPIPVASVTGAPSVNFRIIIDSEIMLVTNVAGLNLTVIRGGESTTAASHSNAAAVAHVLTSASYRGGIDERVATHAALPDVHHAQAHAIGGGDHTGTLGTTGITDAAVTYAKLQDVTAISKLLGRGSAAGAGDAQEITLGTNLAMAGTTLNASGGGSGHVIQESGSSLTARTNLNFDLGIVATDDLANDQSDVSLDYGGTAQIADVAAAESAGASNKVPRADHTHAHGTGYGPDNHHNQSHADTDHPGPNKLDLEIASVSLQATPASMRAIVNFEAGVRGKDNSGSGRYDLFAEGHQASVAPYQAFGQSIPPQNATSGAGASFLTDQRVGTVAVWLEKGEVITSITFIAAATGANTPLHQYFGLADTALARLAVSADDTTTAWALDTAKTLALTAPYTILTSGLYYYCILVQATAVPTLVATGGIHTIVANTSLTSGTVYRASTSAGNQTSIPVTLGALTAKLNVPYCYAK